MARLRQLLALWSGHPEKMANFGYLWVVAGMRSDARRVVRDLNTKRQLPGAFTALVQSRVALADHDFETARSLAERAITTNPDPYGMQATLAADTIASAEAACGRMVNAIDALERGTARRAAALAGGYGGFVWTAARTHLGALYRAVGKEHEARSIEGELIRLLATADPDYPLLVELRHRSGRQ